MPEEGEVLEDEPQPPGAHRMVGHVDVVEKDLPRVGELQAGEDPQERRLAAAGRAEQGEQLPGTHLERNPAQHAVLAEPLLQVAHPDSHSASVSSARSVHAAAVRFPAASDLPGSPSVPTPGPVALRRVSRSTAVLAASVPRARRVRSDATAKAPAKLYSL